MATIREVAERAGVAPITVSRVINRSGYVGEETRRRVEQAIAELEYVPNVLARGLRSRQSRTLGLVVTDVTNKIRALGPAKGLFAPRREMP